MLLTMTTSLGRTKGPERSLGGWKDPRYSMARWQQVEFGSKTKLNECRNIRICVIISHITMTFGCMRDTSCMVQTQR
jgi:hypothetical protein